MLLDIEPLGVDGSEWIRSSLSAGRRLSEALLLSRMLDDGSAYLLGVPAGFAIPDVRDLGESINDRIPASRELSTSVLFEIVNREAHGGTLVVEDDVRTKGDRVLTQFVNDEIVINGSDVYHVYPVNDLGSPSELRKYIGRAAFGFPLNGVVVAGVSVDSTQALIRKSKFADIAELYRLTFHSIFDGDALVAWIPQVTMEALGISD